ncbi:hypothetical protein QJS10_CPA08g00305 [Acorus calamus]|uniref:EGF-like domain-containing protein n=1 Tax=Acorus calamus TaxID=4465 RepID=A0AAV9EA43_ACOCL|nr:hypothetical protein QJS10_CPA08g00305 [Acorus calamus]
MAWVMIVLALQLFSLSLHSTSAFGDDFLAPGLSPALDEMCKHVECGQGTCMSSINETFGYICECDQGWSRYAGNLSYMPCVIPNCYANLVNISYLPCFAECSVEGDCASHGIGLSNSKASSNPPSSSASSESNSAHSIHSLKLDDICNKSVECGKGTCKSSMDYTFGFACECDQGWSQFSDKFRYTELLLQPSRGASSNCS